MESNQLSGIRILPPSSYVFNHFPKTGGISLLSLFRQNLRPDEISPHLGDHETRLKPAACFEQYRLITGHFSLLTQMGFSPERYRLTLLRQPIKRIYSAYTFYRMQPEQNLLVDKAKHLPFAEFVRYFQDSPQVIYDTYTHHFAAIGRDWPDYSDDIEAALAAAKHNLAAFNFVGISEEMESSLRLLCRELGWPVPIVIPFENRSGSETSFDSIDSGTMQLLLERNQNDLKLYEFATQLFREHCKRSADGLSAKRVNAPQRELVPFALPPSADLRGATFSSVSTSWLQRGNPHILEIGVTFNTRRSVPELGLGVMITNGSGDIVWGTNTAQEGLQLEFAVNCQTHAAFLLQCELPSGEYFVTAALSEARRLGFHDHWIDRVASFSVGQNASETPPYRVQPLDFWSAINRGDCAIVPRWRTEKRLSKTFAHRVLPRRPISGTPSDRQPHGLDSIEPKLGLRSQALFDVDTRVARPRVRISVLDRRAEFVSEKRWKLRVEITNLGVEVLSSRYTNPVNLSYHWLSDSEAPLQLDGLRTPICADILPGCSLQTEMIVESPADDQSSILCLTLVQEFVGWFDVHDPANRLLLRFSQGSVRAA